MLVHVSHIYLNEIRKVDDSRGVPLHWRSQTYARSPKAVQLTQAQERSPTLTQAVWPSTSVARDAILVTGFALFTAVAAQISFSPPAWFSQLFSAVGLPVQGTPVPITAQTLAVGITGAALGSRRGAVSLLLYLLAGVAGLPVYAGATAQVWSGQVALGATNGSFWSTVSFWALPSGGYLVGFVAAGFLIGGLAERGWDRRPGLTLLALLLGNALIYVCGLPWLYAVLAQRPDLSMDIAKTLNFGLWPFIPGDLLKLLVATGVLPGAWSLVRR